MHTIETIRFTMENSHTLSELEEVKQFIKQKKRSIYTVIDKAPSSALDYLYEKAGGRPEYIPENWDRLESSVQKEILEMVDLFEKTQIMMEELQELENQTTKKMKDIIWKDVE
jgi:hypothetical protein